MINNKIKKEFKNNISGKIEPKFREKSKLSFEQLIDPDYALQQLEKLNEGRFSITCSKCHHCRR